MAAERTVSVALKAKVDGYVTGFKKAESATKQFSAAQEKTKKSNEMLGRATALVGTTVALAFGKKIVDAASAMNETMSKSGVVFGKQAAAVQSWSKTSATAMGMSQQQALEAAATYGNLFVALGITGDKAAGMSTKMVGLAADLASFNNVSPEEALQALQSGLVGETEPLRKFGVNLQDATLRQEALRLGLTTTTKSVLPPAIKAQAAYALILEQTKTAQGDFGRTSDGLANSQRILSAQWTDAQTALGSQLLPAVNLAVKGLNALLGVTGRLPAGMQAGVLVAGLFAVALLVMLPKIVAIKTAMKDLGVSFKGLGKGAGAVGGVLAIVGALGALQQAMGQDTTVGADTMIKKLQDVQKIGSQSFNTLAGDTFTLDQALDRVAHSNAYDNINAGIDSFLHLSDPLNTMKETIAGVDTALASMAASGDTRGAAARFQALSDKMRANGATVDQVRALFPQYQNALDAASNATTGAAGATDKLGGSLKGAQAAAVSMTDALARLRGEAQNVDSAQSDLEAAFAAATKSVKDNGRTLDIHTDKGRGNAAALRDVADKAFTVAEAMGKAGASTTDISGRMATARGAFVATAIKMGLSQKAAERLADRYKLIPSKISTAVNLDTTRATAQVNALNARLMALSAGDTARERARGLPKATTAPSGSGGRHASGGSIVGPGTGTSDSVPIWASNGEYVIRKSSVDKYGAGMLDHINAGAYANGGRVAPARSQHLQDLQGLYMSAVSDRASGMSSTSGALRDRSQLVGTFDFSRAASALGDLTQAKLKQADAEDALFQARRRSNSAGTPEEQAAAAADQAKAEQDLAAAKMDTATAQKAVNAAKPTRANLLSGFKARAQKLAALRSNLTKLQKMGLSRTILKQILDAGIDDGGDMAAAMVAGGGIAAFNKTQASIDRNSAALGAFGASIDGSDDRVAASARAYGLAGGRVGAKGSANGLSLQITGGTPVVLKINSRTLAEELLVLSRRQGGYALTAKR